MSLGDSSSDGADAALIESKSGARERIEAPKTVTLRTQREIEMRLAKWGARARDQRRKLHGDDLRWRRKEAPDAARTR